MALCPETAKRAAMTVGEFWEYVLLGPAHDFDEDDYDPLPIADLTPCAVCGENGPCGYDAEFRPMVHLVDEEDEA